MVSDAPRPLPSPASLLGRGRAIKGAGLAAAALVLLAVPRSLGADAPPPATDAGLFAFANRLRDDGDHARAVTEYRRLLFHFPRSRHASAARLEMARCHARLEAWDEAEAELARLADGDDDWARTAAYERALVRRSAKQYEAAAVAYHAFATEHPDDPRAAEARWQGAWCLLFDHRLEQAERAFADIKAPHPRAEDAARLAQECRRVAGMPRKSPFLAGVLGIVPGLGHFYVGRYKDGLVSLGVSGLFGLGANSAFRHGAKGAGVVLGLLGANFYAGGLFGGVNWAHRVNREKAQREIDALRREYGL
jgi:tetratricopeptide (TPR) repeat protein